MPSPMQAPTIADTPVSILAVAVLYECAVAQSHSLASLFQIVGDHPELARHFSLVVYDNSPQAQSVAQSANFPVHYFHDPSNGGLAPAYNYALARAEAEGHGWLLLLDQDTSLTSEFLLELLAAARSVDATPSVAMIVAKLRVEGVIHSPTIPFFTQMRHQFRQDTPPMAESVVGIFPRRLCSYNSGSTLRVSALRSIGGFPMAFWLDFLDHAIYHALFDRGFQAYVLRAALAHDASYSDLNSLPYWRMHSVLAAQTLYVKQNGDFFERFLYRIWLLRRSRNFRKSCKDARIWKEALRQALLMTVPARVKPTAGEKR
jgi:GT2 family glycosyltransferase